MKYKCKGGTSKSNMYGSLTQFVAYVDLHPMSLHVSERFNLISISLSQNLGRTKQNPLFYDIQC